MKRILIAFMLLLTVGSAAFAQANLKINGIFQGDYVSDPEVTMTVMSGDSRYLKSRHLSVLSTFKGPAEKYAKTLEPLVLADGAKAVGRNVRYKNGSLYYAFYSLPKVKSGDRELNRYIYYVTGGVPSRRRVTLVYFEGTITQEQAVKFIRSFSR